MPSTLAKNLNLSLCFAGNNIKRPSAISTTPDDTHRRPSPSTTTTSSILYKNFNSLYDKDQPPLDADDTPAAAGAEYSSEPDFATVAASQRFFFASPGRSNSITEPSSTASFSTNGSDRSTSTNGPDQIRVARSVPVKDSVAVNTFSPDPFTDFRRSMEEMAAACDVVDVESDWEYLHQLLMSYLSLNPESLHKYIIGAFADLLVTLMSANGGGDESSVVVGDTVPGKCM